MVKRFTDFTDLGTIQQGDVIVGTRDNENVQTNFDTGVRDSFSNYMIGWGSAGDNSTNYLKLLNAVSAEAALITSVGIDSNVSIKIKPKNSGDILTETNGDGSFIHNSNGMGNFEVNTGGYLNFNTSQPFKYVSDDVTLADDSSIDLVTEHAVKTYVDNSTSSLSNLTFVTNTDETADAPNSQPLSALATGFATVTTTTGIIGTRIHTGTANQITITNGNGAAGNPTYSLPNTLITPGTLQTTGTLNIGGTGATVSSISTDGTLVANSDGLLVTEKAIKTYVDGTETIIKAKTYVTNTNETAALPNSQPLSLLSTGILAVTTTTGILSAVTLTGTANQITVAGGTGASTPTFSLPSTLIAPGTFQATTSINIGGAGATVTSISIDGTLASNSDTLLSTQKAVKTYVDTTETAIKAYTFITKADNTANLPNSIPLSGISTGFLANTTGTGVLTSRTMTGTANQISIANGDGSGVPTFSLPSTLIAPGTFQATTSLNIGGAGATATSISTDSTLASNSDALLSTQKAIKTYVDATVVPLQFAMAALVATSNITLSGIQTVDGVVTTTQVVLAQNQTSAVNNGLWTANIIGAWTRTPGYTTWANFYRLVVSITSGLTQKGTSWQCTVGDTGTVGTDSLTFVAAAFQTYYSGTGLTLTDNIFSLTAPVTIALGGTNTTSAIGASGTLAQSDGSKYTFTTATYPATAGTASTLLRSDGTNIVNSTPTFPNTATTGKIMRANGTNWLESTATYPDTATSAGKILRADGTNWVASTPTFPNTGTSGKLIRGDGTNYVETTAQYPTTSGSSGTLLQSDGTNIVNTTATYPGTSGTSGTLLRSNGTNIVNSTSTFADTYAINRLLYASSANAVTGLATANSSVLTTDGSGVPSWSSTAPAVANALTMNNGGSGAASGSTYNGSAAVTISYNSVGASPLAGSSSLTTVGTISSGTWQGTAIATGYGGTGLSSAGTSGNVLTSNGTTWQSSAAPLAAITWSVVTGTTQTAVARNGYIANNAGTVTVTLPTPTVVGDNFAVTGINNATGWKLAVASGQTIHYGTQATTASTGYLQSTNTYDSVAIICTVANTSFTVVSSIGNITVV